MSLLLTTEQYRLSKAVNCSCRLCSRPNVTHKRDFFPSLPPSGSLDSEAGIFNMTFDKSYSRLITAEADKTIKMYREDPESVRCFGN